MHCHRAPRQHHCGPRFPDVSTEIGHCASLIGCSDTEEYANAVSAFSRLRTGAGQRHRYLAEFLNSAPFALDVDDSEPTSSAVPRGEPFLTLYEIAPENACPKDNNKLSEPREFADPEEFAALPVPTIEDDRGQLIFIRGYPTPAWLNTVGSKYKVDPDFFARHLDYLIPTTSETFPSPALPSSLSHMVTLYVTTIGSRDRARRTFRQSEIDSIRISDKRKMAGYSRSLSAGSDFNAGNALVRYYSTLDESHFTIEQRITVNIHRRRNGWTGEKAVITIMKRNNSLFPSIRVARLWK